MLKDHVFLIFPDNFQQNYQKTKKNHLIDLFIQLYKILIIVYF